MAQGSSSDGGGAWRKRADWLVVAAVLMLGIGFGALASSALGSAAVAALLVGCFTLAWGLVQKQRLEIAGPAQPAAWERGLFWGSALALVGVGAVVIWRAVIAY